MVSRYGNIIGPEKRINEQTFALQELFLSLSEKQLFTCPYFTKTVHLCLDWWDDYGLTLWGWPFALKTRKLMDFDMERLAEKRRHHAEIEYELNTPEIDLYNPDLDRPVFKNYKRLGIFMDFMRKHRSKIIDSEEYQSKQRDKPKQDPLIDRIVQHAKHLQNHHDYN